MPHLVTLRVWMEFKGLEPGWVTWYSYTDDPNALAIVERQRASLVAKGYDVKVLVDGVDESEPVCPICNEAHPEPYDGSCLL